MQLGKYRDMPISSLGMDPVKFTASGSPAVSIDVLQALAGNPSEVRSVHSPKALQAAYDLPFRSR